MRTLCRSLLAATVLAVALAAPGPAVAAPTAPAAPLQDSGAPAEGAVVHSWALAPAGTSPDPNQPGNRATLSYELDPGAVVEDAVTLFNYGNVKLTFRLYATDAFNNDDGEFDVLPSGQPPVDLGTWITLSSSVVTVEPGMQATIPITVRVPADARPGDHAGAVLAANDTVGTGPDGKTVTLDRRTGSRVYLRVSGPVQPELAIENVKTVYEPSLDPLGGSATVTYRVQNRGNVRLSGTHRASVSGPLGVARKRTARQDLPELLPGEGVTVTATFDDVPAMGVELTEVEVEPATEVGGTSDLATVSRTGMALAPPLTVLLLGLGAWLAVRARRAHRRHRAEATLAGAGLP
jgi:hypothetical protein